MQAILTQRKETARAKTQRTMRQRWTMRLVSVAIIIERVIIIVAGYDVRLELELIRRTMRQRW